MTRTMFYIRTEKGENSFGEYEDLFYDAGTWKGKKVIVRCHKAWRGKRTVMTPLSQMSYQVKLESSSVWIGDFKTAEAAASFYSN